jgi:hypothetical protein
MHVIQTLTYTRNRYAQSVWWNKLLVASNANVGGYPPKKKVRVLVY